METIIELKKKKEMENTVLVTLYSFLHLFKKLVNHLACANGL